MMPDYVTHVMPGRARLRHAALGTEAGKDRAMEVLAEQPGVLAFFPGHSSMLLKLDEKADLVATMVAVCSALEAALPELAETRRAAVSKQCPIRKLAGATPRQIENRALLAALAASAVLGFTGRGRAHLWVSAAFCALAAYHVWARRKGL